MEHLLLLLAAVVMAAPIALIIYIIKLHALSGKVADLERKLASLERGIPGTGQRAHAARPTPAPPSPVEAPESAIPLTPLPPTPAEGPAVPVAPVGPPAPAVPTRLSPPPTGPAPGSPPSRTGQEWEALIGGQWLNRIGALALIIGVGFFLKYAFDNDWITETMRVLIGLAAGAGLLFGATRFHKKGFDIFSQGLDGAGISILYLSVYASFNFYQLVPQPVALLMMSAVTVLAFFQAFQHNSFAVSLLGWAGGFLTPALLTTGQVDAVGLFSYIVLLDIGLIAVLIKKDAWAILQPLSLAATYLMYYLWVDRYYASDQLLTAVLFLSLFWGLFYGLDVFQAIRSITTFAGVRRLVAAFNAVFYVAGMYGVIDPRHHQWMGAVTLVIGVVYFATALAIKRRRPEAGAVLAQYTLTAIGLLVLATAIQFSQFVTVACWSVEALVLFWCGVRWKQRTIWQVALGLLGLAIVYLLATEKAWAYRPLREFRLILNPRLLAFASLAAALGISAAFVGRLESKSRAVIRSSLHYGWCLLLFMLLTVETNDYFRRLMLEASAALTYSPEFIQLMTLTAIWMGFSLLLVWFGLDSKVSPILYSGLGALILALGIGLLSGIRFDPIERFIPLLNLRFAVLVFILVGLLLHAEWLKTSGQDYDWIKPVVRLLQVVSVLLIFELITGETRDYYDRAIALSNQMFNFDEMKRLRNLQQLALSGSWLLYSVVLMIVGIWRRRPALRMMSLVLFGVTILKIFFYDLSFLETLYRIFSFMGLGVILLLVSYLYQRYKTVIFAVVSDEVG